jgi:hypothetical protein
MGRTIDRYYWFSFRGVGNAANGQPVEWKVSPFLAINLGAAREYARRYLGVDRLPAHTKVGRC